MKKLYFILMFSVLAVGCNDPKNLVIPREASDMNEFSNKVKNLSDEEKYLLNYYLEDYEDSDYKVPVGTTVKEAIDEQRQYLKKRDKYDPPK